MKSTASLFRALLAVSMLAGCSSYRPTPDELSAWLRDYNDHPDAPGVYRLASARGAAGLTPSSFVSNPRNGRTIAPDTGLVSHPR